MKPPADLAIKCRSTPAVTWGAASINHWWPWPRKNVVMCYDEALDYSDLLVDMDSWGDEPPAEAVDELMWRVFKRMNTVLEEIRGERFPGRRLLGLPFHEP